MPDCLVFHNFLSQPEFKKTHFVYIADSYQPVYTKCVYFLQIDQFCCVLNVSPISGVLPCNYVVLINKCGRNIYKITYPWASSLALHFSCWCVNYVEHFVRNFMSPSKVLKWIFFSVYRTACTKHKSYATLICAQRKSFHLCSVHNFRFQFKSASVVLKGHINW